MLRRLIDGGSTMPLRFVSTPSFFALKTFAAAALALAFALWQDVAYPYWAMMSVYILAQSQSGRLRLKGLHMILGTALGGALGVLVAVCFATSFTAIMVALTVIMMAGTYAALRDRRSHFYFFMLSGITCLLVAVPGMATPDTAFVRAVDRTEDIAIAVCALILVDKLLFPRAEMKNASALALGWLDRLRGATASVLRGESVEGGLHVQAIQQSIAFTPLSDGMTCEGSGYGWDRSQAVVSVVTRAIRLMPVLSGLVDLDRAASAWPAGTDDSFTRALLAEWIEAGCPDDSRSATLRARLRARPTADVANLAAALCARRYLRALYAGWRRIRCDHAQIDEATPRHVRLPAGARLTPATLGQVDRAHAFRGALCVGVQMLLFSLVWQATGWSSIMGLGMLLGAIFTSIVGMTSAPLALLAKMAKIVGIAMAVAGIYMTGVLPAISSLPTLLLVLLPAFYVLGLQVLKPGGVLFGILPIALMQIGNTGPGITVDVLICSVLAIYIGIGTGVIANVLIRQPALSDSLSRLTRATSRGVLRVIERRNDARAFAWDALDRFLLIQTRLAAAPALQAGRPGIQTLRFLRVARGGQVLWQWLDTQQHTSAVECITAVLQQLRVYFERLAHERLAHERLAHERTSSTPAPTALRNALTAALQHPALRDRANARPLRALVEIAAALDAVEPSAIQHLTPLAMSEVAP